MGFCLFFQILLQVPNLIGGKSFPYFSDQTDKVLKLK
jgi:hypothetical protein